MAGGIGSGISEELAAPFDTTARFRFYSVGSSVAQTAVPSPRSDARGIEIHLDGHERNDSAGQHRTEADRAHDVGLVQEPP